jgi:glucose-6-phosphate isomerase
MFSKLKSTLRLQELAKNPVDLTKALNPERIASMKGAALGMQLLYGTERVSQDVMNALAELSKEAKAIEKIEAMQAGEVVNRIEGYESENRPALHTAMRDFFDNQNPAKAAREASKLAWQEIEKLKKFQPEFDRFTDLIQIGIGGSSLGPEAICIGLEAFAKPNRRVHFMSNVDPDEGAKIFRRVDLSKTVVVVVSKSGSTLETVTNETYVREQYKKAGLNPKDHIIAVTGKGSPMDDPAKYLGAFYIWDYIGGRYSVTSMVGAVMLSFSVGMDRFMEFLRGASAMDKAALSPDLKTNLPLISALLGIWNRNFLNHPTVAIIPYSQALARFPAHLQQLDMESNGKRIDKTGTAADFETGPVIWGEPGTNGQHSFFQLLHQGTTVVPLEIIGFQEAQYGQDVVVQGTSSQQKLLANLFAQSIALAQGQISDNPDKFFPGNRPNRVLLAKRLDPFTIGAILAYYEHKVAFQGFIWNINSFDQEGVQLGKKLALKILDLYGPKPKEFPLGKSYLSFLD